MTYDELQLSKVSGYGCSNGEITDVDYTDEQINEVLAHYELHRRKTWTVLKFKHIPKKTINNWISKRKGRK